MKGEKFSKKLKLRILKHSHSAEKLEREDHLGFLKLQFGAKYFYKMKGEPFGDKKMSEKSRRDEKKFRGPYSLARYCIQR